MQIEISDRRVEKKGRALVVTLTAIQIRNNNIEPRDIMMITMEGKRLVLEPTKKEVGNDRFMRLEENSGERVP